MSNKRNLVLYIDSELIEKTRQYGFNLSRVFENHLKSMVEMMENYNSGYFVSSPGETRQETCSKRTRYSSCVKDNNGNVLDEFEVESWDLLTNSFAESMFEITTKFVESKNNNIDICDNIIEQLLKVNTIQN